MAPCTVGAIIAVFHRRSRVRGMHSEDQTMRLFLSVALPVAAVVATLLLTPGISTDADAKQLCRAPGVPKGCVTRPAKGTTSGAAKSSNSYNSYNPDTTRPKGHIIVSAPPGGRPIGHCYDCIAPHHAWPPSGGAA